MTRSGNLWEIRVQLYKTSEEQEPEYQDQRQAQPWYTGREEKHNSSTSVKNLLEHGILHFRPLFLNLAHIKIIATIS